MERIMIMKNILVIQGGGRPNGNTAQLIRHFQEGASEAGHKVEVISLMKEAVKGCLGCNACRYEKYPVKDCALLMTSADNFFWTFEQAVSYYQFAIVNYIGFTDRGMLLAGGCGDTNGKSKIERTDWLEKAYAFGLNLYPTEEGIAWENVGGDR